MKRVTQQWWPLIFLVYFGILTVFSGRYTWHLVFMWLGGLVGLGLELLDRLVYVYWQNPHEQLSEYVRHLVQTKRYTQAIKVLRERGTEQRHLVSRSILFLMVWMGVAIYVVTSTGSLFAAGMILGAGLQLLMRILADWRQKETLKGWLFWHIKRPITDRELQVTVGLYIAVFVLLSLAMI